MIKVYGEKVYATEYPPQEIVDELIAGWYHDFPTNMVILLGWLRNIKKEMDQNNGSLDINERLGTGLLYQLIRRLVDMTLTLDHKLLPEVRVSGLRVT